VTKEAKRMKNNRHGVLSAGIVATAVIVGLLASGGMVLRGTEAAFVSNTNNAGNNWATGSVNLTNSAGSALFTATNMVPGDQINRCIKVTYNGTVATPVKVFVSSLTQTSALAQYLDVTILQGTGTPTADCTTDITGGTNLVGPVTLQTLSTSNSNYTNGLTNWMTLAAPDTRAYKITVKLRTDAGVPQSASAGVTFNWEVQAGL
jgi:hypothetical protein